MLLLDTHLFLWFIKGDAELKSTERKVIHQYMTKDQLMLSAISIWEIANLDKNKRITLGEPLTQWAKEALKTPGLTLAPLTPEILCESVALPGDIHKDPADRMIVATARLMHAKLVTRDKKILEYAEQGYVNCINV